MNTVVELATARAERALLSQQAAVLDGILGVRDFYIHALSEGSGLPAPSRGCGSSLEPGLTPGQHTIVHCYCYASPEDRRAWPLPPLSPPDRAAFVALGVQGLARRWEEVMGRLAGLVEECDACPPTREALEVLKEAMSDGRTLCWRVGHYLPGRFAEVTGITCSALAAPAHWDSVLDALQLQPWQAERMTALSARLTADLHALRRERLQVLASAGGFGVPFPGLHDAAAKALGVYDSAWALEGLVERELRAYVAAAQVFFDMLEYLQCSRLFVHSRPFLPDLGCLAEAWSRRASAVALVEEQ
ncbi:hypothetical protein QBZ16_000697 [Prototheca wickerhamii]|uniref:Uncharacterized protein n=1 Tax=Prototheca wickerhamii TaxID=3111 RepID=A0AAD9IM05_PROWI|nr:hypothetical protein QBZ16_000697 [Prototheca wickerhamii]